MNPGARPRLRVWLDHFALLEDDRESWRVAHPLPEVLLLLVCGCQWRRICIYEKMEDVYTERDHRQAKKHEQLPMPLNIRDPRAAELARDLARRRGTTMTQAIIGALEAEIERERAAKPLAERLLAIAADLKSKAGPNGRRMTKDEIDALWGQ